MDDVGLVAIGRNEGDRLRLCLASAGGLGLVLIYVDSGSSDGSVELARGLGAEVVELDLTTPFTAARARNAGLERLRELAPDARYVQFIDGDCELADGWIDRARRELDERPETAAVCGRLRERHPERSVYNRLADLEWDTPIGEARACGGIAMMRTAALDRVGGFNPELIAGEEPELCVRLRRDGWKIFRIDADMAAHDMAMTRLRQWWRRSVRTGHAFAEGAALHGAPPERHYVRETRSLVAWGMVLPLAALALAWPTRGLSLLALAAAYVLLFARVYRGVRSRRGWRPADARAYACFVTLGKIPGALGVARYWAGRLSGRRSRVIEHRGPAGA
ncbi:glycosyltransferase [Planctomyces sp. SH-PL62]|uniref:glycosyltransferase n=1 Tax=Planctomyces sp. SH-PL62 TaxID=1636152 RepID=UPI00078ECC8F|nr:glycosyltransferase [Planctomyces sp. SH-PL62]AMV40851.1 Glycosyl transferase family 2 [Planctomyces sp. SH-PL62]